MIQYLLSDELGESGSISISVFHFLKPVQESLKILIKKYFFFLKKVIPKADGT